jgi:hypothetical protein
MGDSALPANDTPDAVEGMIICKSPIRTLVPWHWEPRECGTGRQAPAEITQRLNPGYLYIHGNEGPMPHQEVTRSIEMLGRR